MAQLTNPTLQSCSFYPQSPTIIQNCPLFSTDFHYKHRIKRMQAENAAKLLILRVASPILAFAISEMRWEAERRESSRQNFQREGV